jgi:hypothetical protein
MSRKETLYTAQYLVFRDVVFRECKTECGAMAGLAFYPDTTAIAFDEFVAENKPQTTAFFVVSSGAGMLHVDAEQFHAVLLFHANTSISDSHFNFALQHTGGKVYLTAGRSKFQAETFIHTILLTKLLLYSTVRAWQTPT